MDDLKPNKPRGDAWRNKERDSKAGIYPLSTGHWTARFMAYQKQVHRYSKKKYHLNFYEVIILTIIQCINDEPGRQAASMRDVTHYMSWDEHRRGRYFISRLIDEDWVVNVNPRAPARGQAYKLYLTRRCEIALNDIFSFYEVLLSALPPKGGEKVKVKRKPVDIEKKRAKELAKWEGLGGA